MQNFCKKKKKIVNFLWFQFISHAFLLLKCTETIKIETMEFVGPDFSLKVPQSPLFQESLFSVETALSKHVPFSLKDPATRQRLPYIANVFYLPYHVKLQSDTRLLSPSFRERKETNQSRNGFVDTDWEGGGGFAVCPRELKPCVGCIRFKVCISCALVEGLWTVTTTISGWSISDMS